MSKLLQPTDFIPLLEDAMSEEAVNHIYNSVDHLYGFDFSPEVNSDKEWICLMKAKEKRLIELENILGE